MKLAKTLIATVLLAATLGGTALSKSAMAAVVSRASVVKITEPRPRPIIVNRPVAHPISVDARFERPLLHRYPAPAPVTVDTRISDPVFVDPWVDPLNVWATPVYVPQPTLQVNFPVHLSESSAKPIVWQNTYSLYPNSGWVNLVMPVRQSGQKLLFNVRRGASQIDYAEVNFGNGQVQRINLKDQSFQDGTYPLLSFGNQRYVESVDLVARAASPQTNLAVQLQQ